MRLDGLVYAQLDRKADGGQCLRAHSRAAIDQMLGDGKRRQARKKLVACGVTPLESPVAEAVRGRVALSFLPNEICPILHQVLALLPEVAHHPFGDLPAFARAVAVSDTHQVGRMVPVLSQLLTQRFC